MEDRTDKFGQSSWMSRMARSRVRPNEFDDEGEIDDGCSFWRIDDREFGDVLYLS